MGLITGVRENAEFLFGKPLSCERSTLVQRPRRIYRGDTALLKSSEIVLSET